MIKEALMSNGANFGISRSFWYFSFSPLSAPLFISLVLIITSVCRHNLVYLMLEAGGQTQGSVHERQAFYPSIAPASPFKIKDVETYTSLIDRIRNEIGRGNASEEF